MNYLFLGDCLEVLRNELEIKPESVDLIYIDPPFNSKRNYNVFFDKEELQTQRIAFEDTWSLKSVGDSLSELDTRHHRDLIELLNAYQKIAPQVFPYLVMMTLRIIELHKVLKPTGSFYLHCDSAASHYLKTICDAIFGVKNFRNEIVWCYRKWNVKQNQFPSNHDVVLFYTKSSKNTFNTLYIPKSHKSSGKGHKIQSVIGENGKRKSIYLNQKSEGTPVPSWWEIAIINPMAKERLGYPTQKPKALLERIIKASSNEGDVILDSFCGCGTSIDVAESLNRQWIGIDIAPFAVSLIKRRLKYTYKDDLSKFEVRGIPTDEPSAIKLWEQNAFAFEDWWLTELGVFATTYGKKGADKGIDGIGEYVIPKIEKSVMVCFQVKGGKVQSKDIDALMGVVALDRYNIGVLLTRQNPSKPMMAKAAQAGHFEAAYGYRYPKIQILTLADFFVGKQLNLPKENITFKSAITTGRDGQQKNLV